MERLIHIIPTPIGNLEDITLRAIKVLNNVDLILAEDTRVTKKLLNHYNIVTPMSSYHAFNEHKKLKSVITQIKQGVKIALVSDAGTPAISDPGFLLIRECIRQEINIICLPGATACIPALVKSGMSCDRFSFEGFLPTKKGRKKRLENIIKQVSTSVLYESTHKIIKTLQHLYDLCPEREIAVVKEISKLNEKIYRGSVQEVLEKVSKANIKGEFVIILDGAKK